MSRGSTLEVEKILANEGWERTEHGGIHGRLIHTETGMSLTIPSAIHGRAKHNVLTQARRMVREADDLNHKFLRWLYIKHDVLLNGEPVEVEASIRGEVRAFLQEVRGPNLGHDSGQLINSMAMFARARIQVLKRGNSAMPSLLLLSNQSIEWRPIIGLSNGVKPELPPADDVVTQALQIDASDCPVCHGGHPDRPASYLDRAAWLEEMSETHEQEQCSGCGLWTLWKPREPTAAPEIEPETPEVAEATVEAALDPVPPTVVDDDLLAALDLLRRRLVPDEDGATERLDVALTGLRELGEYLTDVLGRTQADQLASSELWSQAKQLEGRLHNRCEQLEHLQRQLNDLFDLLYTPTKEDA